MNTIVSIDFRNRILHAIERNCHNFGSILSHATYLNVSASQLEHVIKGRVDGILSDVQWIQIANKLNVPENKKSYWITANTPVFEFITNQLKSCQEHSLSGLLADIPDIGKSYTAKHYALNHRNAAYIDCSQCKSKSSLVKSICHEIGIDSGGSYGQIYKDLIQVLNTFNNPKPLIILDEAGDLSYGAFLELKALWNATEDNCGWYLMGADGLKVKINRNLRYKKVGYTEIFSRFGGKFQKVSPNNPLELEKFLRTLTHHVALANSYNHGSKTFTKTGGSLRRLQKLVSMSLD